MESTAKKSRRSRSSAEDASETRSKLEVTSSNAHQILEKLSEKLGVSRFGVVCNGDDNPVLRAAVAVMADSLTGGFSFSLRSFGLQASRREGCM